jgi:MoaA/NifB/PqqE/SkfB family radical SAM enzyme
MFDYTIKTDYTCNHNCIHCSVGIKRDIKQFTTQEMKNAINMVPVMEDICFSGGEPTIQDNFLEIINYGRKKNHIISILTNMSRFSDKGFTKEAAQYLDLMQGSFHSYDEKIFNKTVQVDNEYKHVLNGLENILQENVLCMIACVITNLNIDTIYDTVVFLRNISPNIRISIAAPHLVGNAWINKNMMPKLSIIKKILPRILDNFDGISLGHMPFCIIPYNKYDISISNTDKNFFNKMIVPEDRNNPIDLRENELKQKIKFPKCKECIMNNKCSGIYKQYLEVYRNELDLFPIKK